MSLVDELRAKAEEEYYAQYGEYDVIMLAAADRIEELEGIIAKTAALLQIASNMAAILEKAR